jgi:hypothetical protein
MISHNILCLWRRHRHSHDHRRYSHYSHDDDHHPAVRKNCWEDRWGGRGRSGAVGSKTANVTASLGSNPGDHEAALASGSRPLPTRAMVPVENM